MTQVGHPDFRKLRGKGDDFRNWKEIWTIFGFAQCEIANESKGLRWKIRFGADLASSGPQG